MSVLGIGLDLVDVESFDRQLSVAGSTLASQTFTALELGDGDAARSSAPADAAARARRLAGRFAAKEAFLKAWAVARLGRAPAVAELRWLDLEVLNDPWGRPFLRPSGDTRAAVAASIGAVAVHLSITHDGPTAAAVVVLSSSGSS